jgi:hypothetical protein
MLTGVGNCGVLETWARGESSIELSIYIQAYRAKEGQQILIPKSPSSLHFRAVFFHRHIPLFTLQIVESFPAS